MTAPLPLPQRLTDFAERLTGPRVTLQVLADAHGSSHRETLLVFLGAVCLCPVPGVGTVLGLGIVALSVAMWRRDTGLALPNRLAGADVSRELGQRVLRLLARFHTLSARACRPRLDGVVSRSGGRVTAALICWMGVLIALPIPLGNFFPAVAVILVGLGLLRQDGLTLLLGAASALTGTLWLVLLALAVWHVGVDGVIAMLPM